MTDYTVFLKDTERRINIDDVIGIYQHKVDGFTWFEKKNHEAVAIKTDDISRMYLFNSETRETKKGTMNLQFMHHDGILHQLKNVEAYSKLGEYIAVKMKDREPFFINTRYVDYMIDETGRKNLYRYTEDNN